MGTYLLAITFIAFLALIEVYSKVKFIPAIIACIFTILFAGLRYETGFDWVEYENYFELTLPFFSNSVQYISPNLVVEPGFTYFVALVRTLDFSFQAFLLLISLINMAVIYFASKRYTQYVAFVFLVYFGFSYLSGQMAAIRQTLSYSFILISLIEKDRKKIGSSIFFSAIAVSVHTFSVVLVPFIFLRIKILPTFWVAVLAVLGVITAYSGFYVIPFIADNLVPILGIEFLNTKLSMYSNYEGYELSIASLSFIPLHIMAYYLLITNKYQKYNIDNNFHNFAVCCTLLSIFSHSYLGVFPAFWNRLSYMTFLIQAIALTAIYRTQMRKTIVSIGLTGGAWVAGAAIITYTLDTPTSLPYLPYQNAVVVWATGNLGDGRARYAYALSEAEREIAGRRR